MEDCHAEGVTVRTFGGIPNAPAIRDIIRKGATFLDDRNRGWESLIDLSRIDIKSKENCILGQLFGTYEEGQATLGLVEEECCMMGFSDNIPFRADWDFMSQLWKEEIEMKREYCLV